MNLPDAPVPREGFFVTHFLTVEDQACSRKFYKDVLGGKVMNPESPCIILLKNTWTMLDDGGGPMPYKPGVTFEPTRDQNRINSFLNLRVADIESYYRDWRAKGAPFITEPLDNHRSTS